MGARELIHDLINLGITVTVDGDRLIVAPREMLTDDLRASIKAHKADLLVSLATSAEVLTTETEAAPAGPDRCCWPHSSAMNGAELEQFTKRAQEFTRRSMPADEAEAMAERLMIRDREGDDRRVCLECRHCISNHHQLRCGNYAAAQLGRDLPTVLVTMPQRCSGFTLAQSLTTQFRGDGFVSP